MRAIRLLCRSFVIVSVFAMVACGGGGRVGGDVLVSLDAIPDGVQVIVDTAVSAEIVAAGESVTVTCTVMAGGQSVGIGTDVVVTGGEGAVVDGMTVTFFRAGVFDVACGAPDLGLVDETPAVVTVNAGRPATIDTVVDPATTDAGAAVAVVCIGKDANGNEIDIEAVVEVQPAGPTIATVDDGFTLTATAVGTYQVACSTKDGSVTDVTPATLRVNPGAVARVTTELADDTITAGGSTTVTCEAFDAYGNEATGASLYVAVVPELSVSGSTVTGTQAGIWDVTCTPTGEHEAKLSGASLTVEAGEAAGLTLFLIPAKAAYKMKQVVKLGFSLVDAYGNRVPGGEITQPIVEPDEGIELTTSGDYKFLQEGHWVFSACVVGQPNWCDDIDVWCDGTAPELLIEYPERGATLEGGLNINVTGHVSDTVSSVGSLMINGSTVPVSEDGSFVYPLDAKLGMNLIDAIAVDTFGNEFRTLRSFLFSTDWLPQNTGIPAESVAPRSVRAYLDDKLFYNADHTDKGTLSAILEMVVADLDVSALLPSPVTDFEYKVIGSTCVYDMFIPKVTFGSPSVQIALVEGGLNIVIDIPDFYLALDLTRTAGNWECLGDQSGDVTAKNVKMTIRAVISVDPATKKFVISTVGGTRIEFTDFKIKMKSILSDLVISLLRGTIEGILRDQVAGLLTEQINDLDDTINEALEKPIEIPIGPLLPDSNQVVLQLTLVPEVSAFDPTGGLLELSMAVTSDRLIDRQILGSMGRADCLSGKPEDFQFNVTDPKKMQLAAHEDVLSELLFAFWNNAGLNLHVTGDTLAEMGTDLSSYGITDLDLITYALIPPVVTSCNPDNMLTIQIGDLYMETRMGLFGTPTDVHFFLFLELQAVLSIVNDPEKGQAIAIQVMPPTLKDMDIVSVNEEWVGDEDVFRNLILDGLLGVLVKELKDPFVVAIPGFNLKELGGEPEPGKFSLTLPDKDLVIFPETLEQVLGFTYIEADLLLQDPPPPKP